MQRKLTLISAPAGFGKTTLVSSWIFDFGLPILDWQREATNEEKIQNPAVAWLSLDEGDNDPTRFLTYLVAALQQIAPNLGAGIWAVLQSPQPPQEPAGREMLLTTLLNELTTIPQQVVLVLDDYHLIEAKAVDQAHLPPQMHLVITTREDPNLPLARLRARGIN